MHIYNSSTYIWIRISEVSMTNVHECWYVFYETKLIRTRMVPLRSKQVFIEDYI